MKEFNTATTMVSNMLATQDSRMSLPGSTCPYEKMLLHFHGEKYVSAISDSLIGKYIYVYTLMLNMPSMNFVVEPIDIGGFPNFFELFVIFIFCCLLNSILNIRDWIGVEKTLSFTMPLW